jgi:acetyl-CoA carboxylase biotin carboxylase subunit
MAIRKILIANRGEIAVRIIRAAREMGIATVQAVSAADRDMLAARMADECIDIGPPQAARSYLNAAAILDAAARSGADAIHPGYGFLAENAAFAEAVEAAGLVFIGPTSATIRLMGDKAAARRTAEGAGVPTIPGSEGVVRDAAEAMRLAEAIGYPLMIKAAAGGGGRGIRVATDAAALERLLPQASAEARSAFGDGGLYLERFIAKARHIEVQVLGDGHDAVHLFERECSVQRRRQKLWEEAPAACLDEATRAALCASAVRLARAIGYRGAGTLEYLYDEATGAFHFIEMNTRIQVEHPVSEMITGIDLLHEMIHIAAGGRLRHAQADIVARGHAIECRICAEDPARDFLPAPGTIAALRLPGGPGVRFDGMLYPGYTVPPFYDSLLGKLIVWDANRPRAHPRMARALDEMAVEGVPTTLALHRALAASAEIAAGRVHTNWLEAWLATSSFAADRGESR